MHKLFLIVTLIIVQAHAAVLIKKCCQPNESIIKLVISDSMSNYMCIDNEDFSDGFSLIIGRSEDTLSGFPESCNTTSLIEIGSVIPSSIEDHCIDRIITESYNGVPRHIVARTVTLSCSLPDFTASHVEYLNKCCPKGKTYDIVGHSCREDAESHNEEQLLQSILESNEYVYEVDNRICRSDQYAVELTEDLYSFSLSGSNLNIIKDEENWSLSRGNWCVDYLYGSHKIVAHICTKKCIDFGATCVQKCCPDGQHYQIRQRNSTRSTCVPDDDKSYLGLSSFFEPLKSENYIKEIIGLRPGIRCNYGKYLIKMTEAPHYLTSDGRLITTASANGFTRDFCVEVFDNTTWGGTTSVDLLVCFEPPEAPKNFTLSFVTVTLSCVFLAFTLFVYLWLPELRNLHGRTLICHVSVLLMASVCLARVQYGYISDVTMCTIYGYGIYFGYIAAFFWLNVMCFDIWWTFGNMQTFQPFHKKAAELRRFIWYSLYAWVLSVSFTVTVVLLDLYPVSDVLDTNMGNGICWFGSVDNNKIDWPHYIFFVIPLGIVSCINLTLWMLTSRHCARVKAEVHRMQAGSAGDGAKKRFKMDHAIYLLTIRLWVVMGVGWVLEFLSTLASNPQWLWTTVDFINELQGVFIFIILVLKPKVIFLIRKKLGLKPSGAQKNGALSGTTVSTFVSRTSQDECSNLRASIPVDKIK